MTRPDPWRGIMEAFALGLLIGGMWGLAYLEGYRDGRDVSEKLCLMRAQP